MNSGKKKDLSSRTVQNLILLVIGMILYGAVLHIETIWSGFMSVLRVLSPFLYGVVWAYVFDIPVTFFEKKLKNRNVAIFLVALITVVVLALGLTRVVPQIVNNCSTLIENIPQYEKNLYKLAEQISGKMGMEESELENVVGNYQELMNRASSYITNAMPQLFQFGKALGNSIVSVITTIVFCIYILAGKKKLLKQVHKAGLAFLTDKDLERGQEAFLAMHHIFGKFLLGKLTDSLIIGIITFICMCILKIPFAFLISVIVGCTNIIPIAGPFIGGFVGALILILASPQKIIVFVVLILIIQQLDGHVIGPKILGDSTGVSTLWVLFAIVVGGSLFGIMGMILGVPVFACLQILTGNMINERIDKKQKKKELLALRDHKIDTIIFDLDGTLLDTLNDLTDSINAALEKNEMPERSMDEVRSFVGNGIHKLVERSVPEGTGEEQLEQVFLDFKDYYGKHYADKTAPYEGIMELVRYLYTKRIKIAIVSNKSEDAVKNLNDTFFEGMISVALGDVAQRDKKPSPDAVFEALKELDSNVKKAVYVGDSEVDIMTAQNANIPCISVDWGFKSHRFLKENGAKIIVTDPAEIRKIVE